jgi:hypothetical protein
MFASRRSSFGSIFNGQHNADALKTSNEKEVE